MEYLRLSDCADFASDRTSNITIENYISTENMIPNKGGIIIASSIPDVKTTSAYKPNDILLSNIRPYFCKIWLANKEGSCSNDVLVVRAKNDLNQQFLYYVLSDKNFFNWDNVTSKGTKMPRGTPKAIMKYFVPNVNRSIQNKIANILSRYDEAIENNNKRIKFLEQMAKNIYKEWFVRFRFPGWQNAKFENGIPKGWHQGRLSELLEFRRGKNITADEMEEGEVPVISAGIEPSGYHNESNVKGTSLTISSSGANAGYLSIHYENIWAADCMFISENKTRNIYYVYELLNNIRPVIINQQRGAAQPHVYSNDVNHLKLWIPNLELMEKANKLFESLHKEIYNLQQANINLAIQRDLLLPRLMSGKLEVK